MTQAAQTFARSFPAPNLRAIYIAQLIVLATGFAVGWLIKIFVYSSLPMELASPAIVLAALPSLIVVVRPEQTSDALHVLGIAADVIALTICIHFGGGVEMVSGPMVYLVIVVLAGLLLSERAAFVTAAASTSAYASLVWLEQHGWLTHYAPYVRPPERQLNAAVLVGVALFVTAWVALYALRQVRAIHGRAETLRIKAVNALSEDLGGPLAAVQEYAQLAETAPPDQRREYLRRIQHLAQKALGLVHNVLDAAAIQVRPLALNREPLDVNAFIRRMLDACRFDAEQKGVRLASNADGNSVTIAADAQLLGRAVANVVSDGLAHIGDKGTIEVLSAARRGVVTITVRAHGPPMRRPPDEHEVSPIGLPESESAGISMDGAGLSLFITRRIVEAHGGSMEINRQDTACSYVVTLPRESAAHLSHETALQRFRRRAMEIAWFRPPLPEANLRGIYAVKSAAFMIALSTTWALRYTIDPQAPAVAASLVVLIALVPNLFVVFWRGVVPLSLLRLSIAFDVVCITVGIHFGGGVEMVSGPIVYVVIIGLAGLVLADRAAVLAAFASALGYATVAWAEYAGVLPHRAPFWRAPLRQALAVVFVSMSLAIATWMIVYAVRQLRNVYRRADEVRGEVVSTLSHDLKNPLGVVQGYAELAEECSPAELSEYLDGIRRSAARALDLVRSVLDVSALEENVKPTRQPVHLNRLVGDVVALHRLAADTKGICLKLEAAPTMPLVEADAQLISRAVANLISNAIKYTDSGQAVQVLTRANGRSVSIVVSDRGRGIAEDEQQRLFEKYTRASSGQGVEGTGLGLYIVRRIAEAHGGSILVESKPGEGSRFTLALPLQKR